VIFRVARFAGAQQLPGASPMTVLRDCLLSGARPAEAFIWSASFPEQALHPLPARAAGILFAQLGDENQQRTLADKLETARLLDKAGIATPALVAHLPRSAAVDPGAIVWHTPASLFVKPRHGSGGRGTLRVEVVAGGRYRLDGDDLVDVEALMRRVSAAVSEDDILVQEMLAAREDLRDLTDGDRAPVLRLTTAREPGGVPFLHSALLEIAVPGRIQRDFINGTVHVPVDPRTSTLGCGLSFAAPGTPLPRLPWSGAPLAARRLHRFDDAVTAVLDATLLFPGLPVLTWDVMLPSRGPVVLEGNSAGNWILTNLPATQKLAAADLVPILSQWRHCRAQGT
jgi:hypothetical protein